MDSHRSHRLFLLASMLLILVIIPLMVTACTCIEIGDIGPVPVDVVMVDNELFFVLEKDYEIDYIRV